MFSFEDDLPRLATIARILELLHGAVATQRHDGHAVLYKTLGGGVRQGDETDTRPGVRRIVRRVVRAGAVEYVPVADPEGEALITGIRDARRRGSGLRDRGLRGLGLP